MERRAEEGEERGKGSVAEGECAGCSGCMNCDDEGARGEGRSGAVQGFTRRRPSPK